MNGASLRLDKWLWHARFLKSRTLAAKLCRSGKIRLNGELVKKARVLVSPGDVLTVRLDQNIRLVKVIELGKRRGPSKEAKSLYEDLAPLPRREKKKLQPDPPAQRNPGAGRPTKAHRRAIDRFVGWFRGA